MKIKDAEKYQIIKDKNSNDSYSLAVITYLERWAGLMEQEIEKGNKLEDVVKRTSYEANLEGISGNMYGFAVKTLVLHWEHGEELKLWIDKK